ncbi:MAG: hypothetical protein IPJ98_20180 [Bryobacterales bacterium]|nr:hypothetical protein [Bryobacterales bacterium]
MTAQDRSVRERVPSHQYRISATGGEPVAITSGGIAIPTRNSGLDGKALYASHERGEPLYSLTRLARLDWPPVAAAAPKLITGAWDRSVSNVTFSADSRTAYITAEDEGRGKIFQVNADGGAVSAFSKATEGMYGGVVSASGRTSLVARWRAMTKPDNVVAIAPDGQHRLLTDLHSAQTADLDWAPPALLVHRKERQTHPQPRHPAARFRRLTQVSGRHLPARRPAQHDGRSVLLPLELPSAHHARLPAADDQLHRLHRLRREFAADIHSDILRGPAGEIEQAIDAALKEFPFLDATPVPPPGQAMAATS